MASPEVVMAWVFVCVIVVIAIMCFFSRVKPHKIVVPQTFNEPEGAPSFVLLDPEIDYPA